MDERGNKDMEMEIKKNWGFLYLKYTFLILNTIQILFLTMLFSEIKISIRSIYLKKQQLRCFHEFFELLQPFGANGTIH